jgi:hypothetical protein
VSRNADVATPSSAQFTRLDGLASIDPPRYPTSIVVDPEDANHAWVTYSGFNAKTPATPGHVFEVRYNPGNGQVAFTNLDGTSTNGFGDIPATSVIVSEQGSIYVGTDFGVVQKTKNLPVWRLSAAGLPNVTVSDLVDVPERGVLYAATHGQGVWQLRPDEARAGRATTARPRPVIRSFDGAVIPHRTLKTAVARRRPFPRTAHPAAAFRRGRFHVREMSRGVAVD